MINLAVSQMKLVTIVGPLAEFDAVVSGCVINREFHPESAMTVIKKVKGLLPFELENPYSEPLRRAEHIAVRTKLGLRYREFDEGELDLNAAAEWLSDFEARYSALTGEREELLRGLEECRQTGLQLDYVHGVSVPLQDFFKCAYVKFRFGKMPREVYESMRSFINDSAHVFFFPTSLERDSVYGMYMSPRASANQIDSMFASLQFERIWLSERLAGTADEARMELLKSSVGYQARLTALDAEIEAFLKDEGPDFYMRYSYLRYQNDVFNIRSYCAHTKESFYILGWVPEESYPEFSANLERYKRLNFVVIGEDPEGITDYTPPIKLKNLKLFRPFEPFVRMYGLPSYNELDPTPLMAVTYSLFFGLMFGDLGQGLLLILAGYLMWSFKGMWLGRVICYAGASAMLFGLLYGSLFGNEEILPSLLPFAPFRVLEESQDVLQFSIWGGAFFITVSILLNIFNGIRQKNPEKTFFGHGGIAGLILFWGVVLFVLPFLGFGGPEPNMKLLLPCLILPCVSVFLREPLSRLVERRRGWRPEGGTGNFLLSGFFEMFETLLSFMTNTLSFLRVGAYAISHASMMTVVYSLARTATGHNPAVLVIGNLVVTAIEGLLVGIQVLRLEFYELFGRFYSGGGRPYKPMKINYRAPGD